MDNNFKFDLSKWIINGNFTLLLLNRLLGCHFTAFPRQFQVNR